MPTTIIIHLALYAESAPPVGIADKISASIPNIVLARISYHATKIIAKLEKSTYDVQLLFVCIHIRPHPLMPHVRQAS